MSRTRAGFTLIELLVVITLMGALAALAILFMPSFQRSAGEARGAQTLSQTLLVARQTALRDQRPTGVRFWYEQKDAAGQQVLVNDLEYIQQPDDYTGNPLFTDVNPPPAGFTYNDKTVYFYGDDVVNGQPGDPTLWNVQPGDFLDLLSVNTAHRILDPNARDSGGAFENGGTITILPDPALSGSTGQPIYKALLNTSIPFKIDISVKTRNYRISRQPRSTGEDKVTLPSNVVVDLSTNNQFISPIFPLVPNPFGAAQPAGTRGYGDVLFGPSGAVLLPRLAGSSIIFWVRSYDPNEQVEATGLRYFQGEPSLIVLSPRSGFIASYPLNSSLTSPYALVP